MHPPAHTKNPYRYLKHILRHLLTWPSWPLAAAQSNLLRTAHTGWLPQLPSNILPYNASYDKRPSETVSPGEVNQSAARRTAQPGAHLDDRGTSISKKEKSSRRFGRERPQAAFAATTAPPVHHESRPHSSLLDISAVVKCPVDSTVPFSLQRCVAHLRIQKEKNKFHSTAPLRPPIHDFLRLDTSSNPPSAPKLPPSSSSQTRHSREPAAVYQTSAQQPPVLPLPSRWCITLA